MTLHARNNTDNITPLKQRKTNKKCKCIIFLSGDHLMTDIARTLKSYSNLFSVSTSRDLTQFKIKLQKSRNMDFILLDIDAHRGNQEVFDHIVAFKATCPAVEIILFSNWANTFLLNYCLSLGITGLILKQSATPLALVKTLSGDKNETVFISPKILKEWILDQSSR